MGAGGGGGGDFTESRTSANNLLAFSTGNSTETYQ